MITDSVTQSDVEILIDQLIGMTWQRGKDIYTRATGCQTYDNDLYFLDKVQKMKSKLFALLSKKEEEAYKRGISDQWSHMEKQSHGDIRYKSGYDIGFNAGFEEGKKLAEEAAKDKYRAGYAMGIKYSEAYEEAAEREYRKGFKDAHDSLYPFNQSLIKELSKRDEEKAAYGKSQYSAGIYEGSRRAETKNAGEKIKSLTEPEASEIAMYEANYAMVEKAIELIAKFYVKSKPDLVAPEEKVEWKTFADELPKLGSNIEVKWRLSSDRVTVIKNLKVMEHFGYGTIIIICGDSDSNSAMVGWDCVWRRYLV